MKNPHTFFEIIYILGQAAVIGFYIAVTEYSVGVKPDSFIGQ